MKKQTLKTPTEIIQKPIAELRAYERNSRTHSAAQIEKLRVSLKTYGFTNPVLIDKKGVIIAGHGRVQAATLEGMETVPCIVIDYMTEAMKRMYIIADNRLAEDAGWDEDLLRLELGELAEEGHSLELTGFDEAEIEELLIDDKLMEDGFNVEDAIDPDDLPFSQRGDIWILGDHRVICGDATDPSDMAALMDGSTASLLCTDPPYGVDYTGTAGKILNDNLPDDKFHQFLVNAFNNAKNVMRPGAAFYVWHADSEGFNFRSACKHAGLQIRQCLIWVKSSLVLGRQDYQWRHEPCLYGWVDGAGHFFTFDRSQSTVIDSTDCDPAKMTKAELQAFVQRVIDEQRNGQPTTTIYEAKPASSALHPTMKPVKLLGRLIANSSRPMDVVLDPFLGSGSTLVACEQLGRVCHGMELDPKFVDVIVKRFIANDLEPESAVRCIRGGKEIQIPTSFFI